MLENKQAPTILVGIILASFALSLAYSFYFKIRPAVDASAYDRIAWNLVRGEGYKENAGLSYAEDIAILRVGPGYQFFLAGIYFIFGRSYEVVWVINAFLHALTALFAYFLSKEIFKENWNQVFGFASAAFVGFSPDLITMSGMLMTETLAIFLITLSVFLFFKYTNGRALGVFSLIFLAFVFGAAVLTRTTAALMVLPVFYYFFSKKNWKEMAIFVAVIIFVFMPWTARNYKIYGVFIPTTHVFGYDLLVGNHPGATGELEPYPPAEDYLREQGSIVGSQTALKDALVFIVSHPLEFLKITLNRISIYFSFARPTGFWFHLDGLAKSATLALSALYSVLIFSFGFWGIYKTKFLDVKVRENSRRLFWMTLMMPLAVIFIVVETRYRFLVYPLIAVFAGFGLLDLFERRPELKALLAIWGVLFLNSIVDAVRNMDRIAERLRELL